MSDKSKVYENLRQSGLEPELVQALVDLAISEDLMGGVDVTSLATIPETQISQLDLVTRSAGVIAGIDIASLVFLSISDKKIEVEKCVNDGSTVDAKTRVLGVKGETVDLLTAERTALNFLGHLSGIATITNKWVKEISGTEAKIRDTRKTTPGLRELEKYAVRMGGGLNHRMSLSDQALIKDNHIAAAGSVSEAINRVKKAAPGALIEVEVDTLEQLKEALQCSVEIVLLDNMSIEQTKAAVEIAKGSNTKLESSGGLKLENAAAYAATGVDYLAVGALTHSAPVLDIGLDF